MAVLSLQGSFLRHRPSLSHLFHSGLFQKNPEDPPDHHGGAIRVHTSSSSSVNSHHICDSGKRLDDCRRTATAEQLQSVAAASAAAYRDDDGFWTVLLSVLKIVTCFSAMMITTFIWTIIMLILLPFPYERIKQGNVYGHVTGRILMWILGNPIVINGKENSNLRAIYICNHASPLDIFLVMWLTPTGTVGIAKKEIVWYPLFGQLYVLANHLRIDRTNSSASIQSMRKVAKAVVAKSLSLIVFPEGTRSATGRLLPFKKGFVHLAIQTKLPIVPIVVTGTHLAWQKNSLRVRPAPLTVTYLPPIKTDDWTSDKVEDYVKILHELYVKHLPSSQKPLEKVHAPQDEECMKKSENALSAGLLQTLPIPHGKWTNISMDFITCLPTTKYEWNSIFVVMDRLTKSAHFISTKAQFSAKQVASIYGGSL